MRFFYGSPAAGLKFLLLNFGLALFFSQLISACGKEEKKQEARVLPVSGLSYSGFSLAPANDSCGSLVEFVKAFSAQHVSGLYTAVSCTALSGKPTKLSFDVKDPGNQTNSLGEVVVYQTANSAEYLVCQTWKGSLDKPAGSYCTGVSAAKDARNIPESMKKNDVRVHDFLLTFADYLER